MNKNIGVSVCVFNYNYENYIEQAVLSVINQKCNFLIEIIIGDDASTDRSLEIVTNLQLTYPDLIKLNISKKNLGGTSNWINTINQCNGKYIALLDGDDYFTDELKLQKQFDNLEINSNSVMCFHAVEEVYEDSNKKVLVGFEKDIFTMQDFISRGWFIRTSSTFFRNNIISKDPPLWIYNFPYRYDTILHVFLSQFGNTSYINENMSVWRKHEKGVSNSFRNNIYENIIIENKLAKQLDSYTNFKFTLDSQKYISKNLSGIFISLVTKFTLFKYPKLFILCLTNMSYSHLFKLIRNHF